MGALSHLCLRYCKCYGASVSKMIVRSSRESLRRERLSTVDLLALTNTDQLICYRKHYFFTKQAIFMRFHKTNDISQNFSSITLGFCEVAKYFVDFRFRFRYFQKMTPKFLEVMNLAMA